MLERRTWLVGLGASMGGNGGGGKVVFLLSPPLREKNNFSRGLSERVRDCEGRKEEMFKIFFLSEFLLPGREYLPNQPNI